MDPKWVKHKSNSIANLVRNRFVSDFVILVQNREADQRRGRSSGEERCHSHPQHVPHLLLLLLPLPFSNLSDSTILISDQHRPETTSFYAEVMIPQLLLKRRRWVVIIFLLHRQTYECVLWSRFTHQSVTQFWVQCQVRSLLFGPYDEASITTLFEWLKPLA